MKSIQEQKEIFDKIMTLLERHLGSKCEAVLHDLTREYSNTIVDIRNGHVTSRKTGDSGSNLGLEVLRGTVKDGDKFNYITYTRDNKVLRSSSIYFKGDEDKVIGALCINLDITQSLQCEEFLHEFNQFPRNFDNNGAENKDNTDENPPVKEIFAHSIQELMDYLIGEAQARIKKPVSLMQQADKLQFIRFLDEKGAFLITHSGDAVCEFLEISKYTLYRYLKIIRNGQNGENFEQQAD